MDFIRIISSALAGTTAMTLFTYVVAEVRNNQFKEPQLLNSLLSSAKSIPGVYNKRSIVGWILHYCVGTFFILCFSVLWNFTTLSPSWTTATVLGIAAGILGIFGWQVMFSLNQDPPEIKLNKFYIQLLVAHVIFSLGAFIVYSR